MTARELIAGLSELSEEEKDLPFSFIVNGEFDTYVEVETRCYFTDDHGYDYDTEDRKVSVECDKKTDEYNIFEKNGNIYLEVLI